jgi:hypothetical protein
MKRFNLLTILCALTVLLSACGTQKLRPEVSSKLRNGNVATMYYMESKKIKYHELVYKVLWNEEREQDAVFEGFWDIDKDLSERYSEALVGHGIKSRPIQALLPEESEYKALVKSLVQTYQADGTVQPLRLSQGVSKKLKGMGLDYLVIIDSDWFYGDVNPMFSSVLVYIPSFIIVYDINGDKEEYREVFGVGSGSIDYEKSPREIEDNGLRKLKDATYEWLQTSTGKRLPEALSLTPQT